MRPYHVNGVLNTDLFHFAVMEFKYAIRGAYLNEQQVHCSDIRFYFVLQQ